MDNRARSESGAKQRDLNESMPTYIRNRYHGILSGEIEAEVCSVGIAVETINRLLEVELPMTTPTYNPDLWWMRESLKQFKEMFGGKEGKKMELEQFRKMADESPEAQTFLMLAAIDSFAHYVKEWDGTFNASIGR